VFGLMPESLVPQIVQLSAGQYSLKCKVDCRSNMASHFLIVTGDDLELYPAFGQIGDDLRHVRLRWIEEEQEACEGKPVFISVRIGCIADHL